MESTERVGVLQSHNHKGEPCGCIITKDDLDRDFQAFIDTPKPVTNPTWPRCECGHRKAKHFRSGVPVRCMWSRPNPETGVIEYCDCTQYWVLEEKLKEVIV
jgi:hypothetical protein